MKQLLTLLLITAVSCTEKKKQPMLIFGTDTVKHEHSSNIVIVNGDTLVNSDTGNVHVSVIGNDVTVIQNGGSGTQNNNTGSGSQTINNP